MSETSVIFLVLGAISLIIFIWSVSTEDNKNENGITFVNFVFGFLMAFSFAVFSFFQGVNYGATKTAKGKYEIYYKTDKNGVVTDTLVDWRNSK